MSQRDNDMRRNLLHRRAERAQQFVISEQQAERQLQLGRDFFDSKMRAYSHIALQYVVQQVRAYEYVFLSDYTSLDLTNLRRQRMNADDLLQFVTEAQVQVREEYDAAGAQFTNGGGSCALPRGTAATTVAISASSAIGRSFAGSGELSLSIQMPESTSYYSVTFSDVRAYLIGLRESPTETINIDIVKGAHSLFRDREGNRHDFTHEETTPPIQFSYDFATCEALSTSDGRLQSGNVEDVYIRYSPYGPWRLAVQGASRMDLTTVTAVRLEFSLQYMSSNTGAPPAFFHDGSGCGRDLAIQDCGGHIPAGPSPPAPSAASGPCSTFSEFSPYSNAVTAACCSQPGSCDGAAGLPTACNNGCAEVLMPMQQACDSFLHDIGLDSIVAAAVALCDAPPCTTFAEFGEYAASVTASCCSDGATCPAGIPNDCGSSAACQPVLLNMQRACTEFLETIGQKARVDTALGMCGGGH
eukprot:COSAG02_NODE_5022_length_4720_cov_5.299502_1_plen_471_part_00